MQQPGPNPALAHVLPIFLCPSETESKRVILTTPQGQPLEMAITDYQGVNGTNFKLQDGMLGANKYIRMADVLERVVSGRTKQNELHTLLPWNWIASPSATITSQAA